MGACQRCKSCGKEECVFLGSGRGYPQYCLEMKDNAAFGKFGWKLRDIVLCNPDGNMDCEKIIYACDCGGWRSAPKMAYYIVENPDEYYDPENNYSSWEELSATPLYQMRHLCPRCRKKMHPYQGEITDLKCPKCGGELEFMLGSILWD